jgi:peptide chain release factor 1
VHTSAAAVVVLPEVQDVDVNIEAKDLYIETMRYDASADCKFTTIIMLIAMGLKFCYSSQGAGGQHVNTTDSAVQKKYVLFSAVVGIAVGC